MTRKVPIITVIIGEGASGGALGIGVGNRVLMLENTWYSVISPESCSSTLEKLGVQRTSCRGIKTYCQRYEKLKLVDEIVKEPLGGATQIEKVHLKQLKKQLLNILKN